MLAYSPECYAKATCTVTVHANGGFWSGGDDWCGCHGNVHKIHQNVIRKHSSCGAADNYGEITFTEHHGPGIDGFTGYDSSTHSYDKLSCGKTNATFVGWDVGCGFVDGDRRYDPEVHATALSSHVMAVENTYIPKRYEDYATVPNSENVNIEEETAKAEGQEAEKLETVPEETAEEKKEETTEETEAEATQEQEETELIERESETISPSAEEIETEPEEYPTEKSGDRRIRLYNQN